MTKTMVVINEQHSLLEEQQGIIDNFQNVEFYKVPATGMTAGDMIYQSMRFVNDNVVFVSPVPYMLGLLAHNCTGEVYVMHNDNREKKELPNGKVISVVAKTGWVCLKVN